MKYTINIFKLEMRRLLFSRTWWIMGLYFVLANLIGLFQLNVVSHSVSQWELFIKVFEGPPIHASVLKVLMWISIPLIFLLQTGEPIKFTDGRQYLLISRVSLRSSFWLGKVLALYMFNIVFVFVGLYFSWIFNYLYSLFFFSGSLNKHYNPSYGLYTMLWIALNVLVTLTIYTTGLLLSSMLIKRSGIAMMTTLIIGYFWTEILVEGYNKGLYILPIAGSQINVQFFGGILTNSFIILILIYIGYICFGTIIIYVLFRKRLIV